MNLDGFTYGEILELFKALHFGVGNNMVPSDFKKWLDNLSECPEEKYKFTDRSNMMKFVKDISCNQVLRNFDIQLWSELISRRVTNCKYEDMQRCWVCGDNVYKYSKRRECFRHQGTEKCLACDEPATDGDFCEKHVGYVQCETCGKYVEELTPVDEDYDEVEDEEDASHMICNVCLHSVHLCGICDNYFVEANMEYIERYDMYVCDNCFERFQKCDWCGYYDLEDNCSYLGDKIACDSCIDNEMIKCDICGEPVDYDGEFYDNKVMCKKCYDAY